MLQLVKAHDEEHVLPKALGLVSRDLEHILLANEPEGTRDDEQRVDHGKTNPSHEEGARVLDSLKYDERILRQPFPEQSALFDICTVCGLHNTADCRCSEGVMYEGDDEPRKGVLTKYGVCINGAEVGVF